MSSDSDAPGPPGNPTAIDAERFTVTIPRDGSVHYEFANQDAVEQFFGTRVATTVGALREVVREIGGLHPTPTAEDPASPAPRPERSSHPLPEDSIIDQRSGLVPKDLYLRLARQRVFLSRKIGKRIVARWGDVRAAFLNGPGVRSARSPSTSTEPEDDGLDHLRRQLGLAEKSK